MVDHERQAVQAAAPATMDTVTEPNAVIDAAEWLRTQPFDVVRMVRASLREEPTRSTGLNRCRGAWATRPGSAIFAGSYAWRSGMASFPSAPSAQGTGLVGR
jgi:hypothetical protein